MMEANKNTTTSTHPNTHTTNTNTTTTTTTSSTNNNNSNTHNSSTTQTNSSSNSHTNTNPNINNSNNNNNNNNSNVNPDQLSKTNLYIRGLQSNTTDQDLYNMCRNFGQISSTKAILEKDGACKGYGFVEYTEPKAAELAVQELTKSGIQAQMAKISPVYSANNHHHHHNYHNYHHHPQHQNQQHHYQNSHQQNLNNNHNTINNNSNHNNDQKNSTSTGTTGNVPNSSNYGNNTNNSSNVSSSGSHQHNNSSSNNSHNADYTNLYIANLPPNMSEQELENLLSNYGPVVSTRILRDHTNIPRGVGFARMESRDKCEQIIEQLNGRPYKGWKEPLLVKFADGSNKKRHHNNHQHQHHNHHHNHNNNQSQHQHQNQHGPHQHQHHYNNHHQHHKNHHQDDSRWRDNSFSNDFYNVSSFYHQGNMSHSNHLTDLSMMNNLAYPRIQPGFPANVPTGAAYPASLVPPTSAPQWIHPGSPGQAYVISQQMIQAGALGPSNQAAAAAMHFSQVSHLTSQMQGLHLAHGRPVRGYLGPPPQQWSGIWPHPVPGPQGQSPLRIPLSVQQQQQPPPPPPHQPQLPPQQMASQPGAPQPTSPQSAGPTGTVMQQASSGLQTSDRRNPSLQTPQTTSTQGDTTQLGSHTDKEKDTETDTDTDKQIQKDEK